MGFKNLHLLDLYKFTFQLDRATELSLPKVPQHALDSAKQKMTDYKLPWGRTVILAPDANSTPTAPHISFDNLWSDLARRLICAGFTVVALTNKNLDFLPQIPRICFPLIEAIPLVEMCGWVIANRSGFCDLVATANAKLTVLYPERSLCSGTVHSCYSLRSMKTNKSADEIIISKSCRVDKIIEQIMGNGSIDDRVYNY